MKCRAIEKYSRRYSIRMMCRVLDVSTSGFYAWRGRTASARAKEDERLRVHIRVAFRRSRETYGAPRILKDLRDDGFKVSKKRVARLMREEGLVGRAPRRFKKTTLSEHGEGYAPNLLQRNFVIDEPNRAWVGDITAIRTWEGWMYLAVLIDLYSRKVVGYALDDEMPAQLCVDAWTTAARRRRPGPGLVCHTDRGSQYASKAYRAALDDVGAQQSMSRKGDCWDNAVAESFFSTLKTELVCRRSWPTKVGLKEAVRDYIDEFYNPQRRHSANGGLSPVAYEVRSMRTLEAA